ncbi:YqcC family protein [Thalassomonas sp. RHCl1]|uniref:YqcC family protein n=1 Tax=Thalassomonas sp. RHCl1 TaxID=2995320 RepID=UPI00248AE0EF|nr:YqcC family protein [Thalassomonas sp. RHCl1]
MNETLHQKTSVLLTRLTAELKHQQLWQLSAVPAKALQSSQPFCCDTLTFEQWLQFVFIPKLGQMAEQKLPLPTNMALCPMAEEAFKHRGQAVAALVNIIGDLDELLSGKRAQTLFVKSS